MAGDSKSPPIEAIGRNVAASVRALRGRPSLQALSDRLTELGRRILPIGLSRLENGGRRVDADDLVALAIALGVNPNALLLPRDLPPDAEIELTPRFRARAWQAWAWMDGRQPLPGTDGEAARERFAREAEFTRKARPAFSAHGAAPAVLEAYEFADRLEAFLSASDPSVRGALRDRALRQARVLLAAAEEALADDDAAAQLRDAARTLPAAAVDYAPEPSGEGSPRP